MKKKKDKKIKIRFRWTRSPAEQVIERKKIYKRKGRRREKEEE